jgi:hypothetical protein
MGRVLSLKLNDAAVELLGVLDGRAGLEPPGGLAPGLRERAARGIARRGEVLTWTTSTSDPDLALSRLEDLTRWEALDSSFHLEDAVPVDAVLVDGGPVIARPDQRTLLQQGLAFVFEFGRLVYALEPPSPVRCIVGVNESNGTFRFHQIRPGEGANSPDLDGYHLDKMIVLDIDPAGT